MTIISAKELQDKLKNKKSSQIILDVRTSGEYNISRIKDTKNIPLDSLQNHIEELKKYDEIIVHCQSGNRSSQACKKLKELGFTNIVNVDGGLNKWEELKLPVIKKANALPIMRQVLIAAGSLVILGFILAWLFHPFALGISLFVGCGLLFSGITGACPMAMIIGKMPWNN